MQRGLSAIAELLV